MTALDSEDLKLVTLAKSALARGAGRGTQGGGPAAQGAAVRDTDGRTYVATSVHLPSLRLSALQVAVAMAVSSQALGLEAAVLLGDDPSDPEGVAAVRDVAPGATVYAARPGGEVTAVPFGPG